MPYFESFSSKFTKNIRSWLFYIVKAFSLQFGVDLTGGGSTVLYRRWPLKLIKIINFWLWISFYFIFFDWLQFAAIVEKKTGLLPSKLFKHNENFSNVIKILSYIQSLVHLIIFLFFFWKLSIFQKILILIKN